MRDVRVSEVVDRLAERTQPERAAEWDQVGLQVGDPAAVVRRVAVVHEVTERVTRRLEGDPVDLVVSYHPLLFRPAGRLVPGRSPSGRAVRLLQHGVAVVVTHTDFDVMAGGMADAMAEALGLTDVAGFAPVSPGAQTKFVTFVPADHVDVVADAMADAGAGRIGDYERCAFIVEGEGRFVAGKRTNPTAGTAGIANCEPEIRLEMIAPASRSEMVAAALARAHPYEEPAFDMYDIRANPAFGGRIGAFVGMWDDLLSAAADAFGSDGLRTSLLEGSQPRRVAVSPGAGESRIAIAASAGCDLLLSGDISHHRMVEANDRGLSIVDVGHAASERPGMRKLVALVEELMGDDVELVDLT